MKIENDKNYSKYSRLKVSKKNMESRCESFDQLFFSIGIFGRED